MSTHMSNAFSETIFLRSDNGSEITFQGQMFSEGTYFDEDTSTITRIRLYRKDNNQHVYSILSGAGPTKSRRHYIVTPGQNTCEMSDGLHTLTIPTDALFASVFGLCGIEPERADELRPAFEAGISKVAGD